LSLAELWEIPRQSLILLLGTPGAGKSTFCLHAVLSALSVDRPVIFVTTEAPPAEMMHLLREEGMADPAPGALHFVDAFSQTVGLASASGPEAVQANCQDLNSLSMAIARLAQRISNSDILLAFDSLTSPYLFNKSEVFRFIRLCLEKFAAQGNSVLALVDEGCGKAEDLTAMISVADGIIRMEPVNSARMVTVIKHPHLVPATIEMPMPQRPMIHFDRFDPQLVMRSMAETRDAATQPALRKVLGDSVNMLWRNLAFWSGMLWDPKRFPKMMYECDRAFHARAREATALLPWYTRFLIKLLVPRNFSEVRDFKKLASRFVKTTHATGLWEYVEEASSRDEHHFRVHENASCWTLRDVGARLAFADLGALAGILRAFEQHEREWNLVETQCVGMGAPYCEFKAVPHEPDGLKGFLEGIDSAIVERVHDRLMNHLTAFMVRGEPLPERPRLGSDVPSAGMLMVTSIPALVSDRYRMALSMGGAKVGKELGEHLMHAGLEPDDAIQRVMDLFAHCKIGLATVGETIRLVENCETFGLETDEPACFFTTGFLNGFFYAVKHVHLRETRCQALGAPYCEWEFR
jgi:predicted hydrocarbon binding protein/KaiC/GvpD/RAD55 family RecA-like ATPase